MGIPSSAVARLEQRYDSPMSGEVTGLGVAPDSGIKHHNDKELRRRLWKRGLLIAAGRKPSSSTTQIRPRETRNEPPQISIVDVGFSSRTGLNWFP
jgi:hypothetical protein